MSWVTCSYGLVVLVDALKKPVTQTIFCWIKKTNWWAGGMKKIKNSTKSGNFFGGDMEPGKKIPMFQK